MGKQRELEFKRGWVKYRVYKWDSLHVYIYLIGRTAIGAYHLNENLEESFEEAEIRLGLKLKEKKKTNSTRKHLFLKKGRSTKNATSKTGSKRKDNSEFYVGVAPSSPKSSVPGSMRLFSSQCIA